MNGDPLYENEAIIVSGARVHNLKNVHVRIPRNKLVVVTGLSGSGKSSLVFDTIYAEGQRRYVESLSSYARQFLGRMHKPEVDYIKGIPPAIAIEQKVNTRNPRSTVGTSTEIYDYLKLLYARIGKTYSPVSGNLVKKETVSDVVDYICSFPESTRALILSPLDRNGSQSFAEQLEDLSRQGITRLEVNGEVMQLQDAIQRFGQEDEAHMDVVVDRFVTAHDEDSRSRYADSCQMAFGLGSGSCKVRIDDGHTPVISFSDRFEADGMSFEEPSEHMFSFNNPLGACPQCEGYGMVIGIDEDLVIPNKSLSVYEDAVVCWNGEKMQKWKQRFIMHADKSGFPVHRPYRELTPEQKDLLWNGSRSGSRSGSMSGNSSGNRSVSSSGNRSGSTSVKGIHAFFHYVESKKYKIQYRVMLARYRGKTTCPTCNGSRLKKEVAWVKIRNTSLQDLVLKPVSELVSFFRQLELDGHDMEIAGRILTEIQVRLQYLQDVGLGYLTLNRLSSTLSGGESQRINLATTLGSNLVGSLYILDEPSIGLHPRDIRMLMKVLLNLRDIGNTVLIVEHEEEIIRAADEIIDIGPLAGRLGGEVLFQGSYRKLLNSNKGLTAKYLRAEEKIHIPGTRRKWNNAILVEGAGENNLKGISVKIPLQVLTVITGVSGSGKSSLVKNILYPALNKHYNGTGDKPGRFDSMGGDLGQIGRVEMVDQNPIGKSSRSNPVTYIKAFDDIRKLFANQQLSKYNGYTPSHFSFNIDGGRCEECLGEGVIKVEMQFMADVYLECESCHGRRFKEDVLEVTYQGKNIFDILESSVDDAIAFFGSQKGTHEKAIARKLQPLSDVGLGYVNLGQSSSTLSGGESQRVKLASFLGGEKSNIHTLFIFDEPTTGLHFHDIKKLLEAFQALIKRGHSVLIIEHNPEVIKMADWVIDLGPEGGEQGGHLVFEGTVEDLCKCNDSYTGKFLRTKVLEQ